MENIDITGKIKALISFGLIIPLATAAAIGYGAFKNFHSVEDLQIVDAKVEGTMVSVRTLVDGKVNEVIFNDGDEVRAGDVIARLEVSVTPEAISQLEETVDLAKSNYEELKLGQIVTVPVIRYRTIAPPPSAVPDLASLAERASKMAELYELGAVSRVQRDAAQSAYQSALAESYSPPEPTVIEEIEYVEQWQATPPEALLNAENAIKQAELSLNVALQEAQENEIIAPVSGTIYYSAEMDGELIAGNTVATIGDSNDLWLAAEVSEDTFDKISLGAPVDYVLSGYNLSGTVIEKIAPDDVEVTVETVAEIKSEWIPPTADNQHPEIVTDKSEWIAPTADNSHPEITHIDNQATETIEPINDKYILRFSLPAERNFDCKPNTTTTVNIKIF